MIADRIPPQALESEAVVIGSLMIDRSISGEVFGLLSPDDFYAPVHALIFRAMMALDAASKPLDKIAVCEALQAAGALEKCGGASYLTTLMDTVQTASTAIYHATVVAEKAQLRALIAAGSKIISAGYAGEADIADAIAISETTLRSAIKGVGAECGVWLGDVAQVIYQQVDAAASGSLRPAMRFPWPAVDRNTGGAFGGEVIVIAGQPGVGKSTAAVQVAVEAATMRGPVALFPLEMGAQDTVRRYLAQLAKIDVRGMRRGDVKGAEWDRLGEAISDASQVPIKLFDSTRRLSVADIRRHCRDMEQLSLIVVDHPGFLAEAALSSRNSKHERLESAYLDLRTIGKELNVPMIFVQHLKRDGSNANRKPTLSDIRDGGNLEGIASIVIFPHRPDDENPSIGEFIIAKNRDGRTGSIPMRFNGASFLWEESQPFRVVSHV